jgi:site-specific recombinase XerD
MGRPSEGWKLNRKPGRRCWSVKFTHAGKAYELGTGEEDETRAAQRAAELYAGVVSGNTTSGGRRSKALEVRPIQPITQAWLDSVCETLDPTTLNTYKGYCDKHIEPFFKTIEAITTDGAKRYIQHRLKSVLADSVRKELCAIRGLVRFVYGEDTAPIIPLVPKRSVGKRHKNGKRTKCPLAPWEVYEILFRLPKEKRTKGRVSQVRARYHLQYETSLRPETIAAIRVPEHYTKGSTHLRITDEIDKARFGREVPLSARARAILDTHAPDVGLIFGPGVHRKALRIAALEVIGADRARAFHPYAFRGNRLTHLAEKGNLPGVQWLAGHKKLSTTAIYAQGTYRAAEDVLAL